MMDWQPSKKTSASEQITFSSLPASEIELYYSNHIKEQKYTDEQLSDFIALLRVSNCLFAKINPMLAESLLKLGLIVTYQAGEAIYKQDVPIRNVGILLWGQTLLRKRQTKFKFNCYPGSAFGEELILERLEYSRKPRASIEKGEFLTSERCKAVTGCGVLFVGEREYHWIYEELAMQGLKDLMLCFEGLIQRTYLKKR
jgi:hypothetical protein